MPTCSRCGVREGTVVFVRAAGVQAEPPPDAAEPALRLCEQCAAALAGISVAELEERATESARWAEFVESQPADVPLDELVARFAAAQGGDHSDRGRTT